VNLITAAGRAVTSVASAVSQGQNTREHRRQQ
jgi:hypothetical protein